MAILKLCTVLLVAFKKKLDEGNLVLIVRNVVVGIFLNVKTNSIR